MIDLVLILFQQIQELAQRAERYSNLLQQSEIQTRYTLIDPILRVLGWSLEDPARVHLEYQLSGKTFSYALFDDGKLLLIIQALPLGQVFAQQLNCLEAIANETPYFAITDGKSWEVWETHGLAIPGKKSFLRLDIRGNPQEEAKKANFLQLAFLKETAPPVPIFPIGSLINMMEAAERDGIEGPIVLYLPNEGATVTSWQAVPLKQRQGNPELADLIVKLVRWLVDQGKLKASHCPIQRTRGKYILHTVPRHPSGIPFSQQQCRLIGSVWLDTKYNRRDHLKNIETILRHIGEETHRYGLRWREGSR